MADLEFETAVSAILNSLRNRRLWPSEEARLDAASLLAERILAVHRRNGSSGSGNADPVVADPGYVQPLNQIERSIMQNFQLIRDMPTANRDRAMESLEWFWARTKHAAFLEVQRLERAEHEERVREWAMSVSVEKTVK